MSKTIYRSKRGLGVAFYLSGCAVFLALLVAYIVWACLTSKELERNEGILTSISSAIGLGICASGLAFALKGKLPHAFFLSGLILSLLSLRGLFDNVMPALMDGGVTLSGWGVAAVIVFSLLAVIGIISSALPKRYLFVRKFLTIIGMTVLIAIDGVTFVSEVISLFQNGAQGGGAALATSLNALTNLVPIATLGVGIAFLLDVGQETT